MKSIRTVIAPIGFAIVLSVTGILGGPRQSPTGIVRGTVVRTGTSDPVPNVQITLATDTVDPAAFEVLRVALQSGGAFVGNPTSDNGDLGVLQGLTEGAISRGVSPLSGELLNSMNSYREQTARLKTMTDGSGQFTIADVPSGPYTIRAARDGYFGETERAIRVLSGQTTDVSFSVLRGATISGRIRGEDGNFVAGATVSALQVRYFNTGDPFLAPALTATTNFKGEYRLFWLMPGEYVIGAREDPEFYTEPPLPNSGAPGLRIRIFDPETSAPTYHPNASDVTRSTPIVVKVGENIEGIDVQIRPVRKVHVSGTLRLPSVTNVPGTSPRYQSMVALVPRDRNNPSLSPVFSMTAVEEGSTQFDAVAPPGAYDLTASVQVSLAAQNPNGPRQQPQLMGTYYGYGSVDVTDHDVNVSVTMVPEAKTNVTLTIDGAPPAPALLPRISMSLLADSGAVALGVQRIRLDSNGTASTTTQPGVLLRPGISGLPPDVYVSELRKNGVSVSEPGITLDADSSSAIQIVAKSGGGVVQGVARNVAGTPLRAVSVALVPSEPLRQNKMLFKEAKTDLKGQFTITGIAPGDYKLFTWEKAAGGVLNARYLSQYESAGIPVTVSIGSTTTKDLVAIPAVP